MKTVTTFREQGWSAAWSFDANALVVCPRCEKSATVTPAPGESHSRRTWRVTCVNCGYAKEKTVSTRTFDDGSKRPVRDSVFRLPLWLQATCCGASLLWAYNIEHLDVLEAFIAAKIRYKRCTTCGRHHQRMIHKLPAWMKSAKNRDELLAAITKLRSTTGAPR